MATWPLGVKPPCKEDGIDCPNRAVGCQGKCEAYAAFRKKIDEVRKKKNAECISADYVGRTIYAHRHRLKNFERARQVLAQR